MGFCSNSFVYTCHVPFPQLNNCIHIHLSVVLSGWWDRGERDALPFVSLFLLSPVCPIRPVSVLLALFFSFLPEPRLSSTLHPFIGEHRLEAIVQLKCTRAAFAIRRLRDRFATDSRNFCFPAPQFHANSSHCPPLFHYAIVSSLTETGRSRSTIVGSNLVSDLTPNSVFQATGFSEIVEPHAVEFYYFDWSLTDVLEVVGLESVAVSFLTLVELPRVKFLYSQKQTLEKKTKVLIDRLISCTSERNWISFLRTKSRKDWRLRKRYSNEFPTVSLLLLDFY